MSLYDIILIRPKSLVIFPYYEGRRNKNKEHLYTSVINNNEGNKTRHNITKESNFTKGRLSDNSIRKLRYAVQLLDASSKWTFIANELIPAGYNFKLGFLTLTLPSAQGAHSDELIKRRCLMPFLTALRKKYGKFSYVWKAEAQSNGNIHFHITLNKWIKHSILRKLWNKRLKELGYISEYRREQRDWHKGKFRPRPKLYKSWSLEKQKKAYEYGCLTNWNDPNTIDIHAVHKINNLTSYIIKYMSKKEDDKRAITGKIWGCSENLTYNNKFERILNGMNLNTHLALREHFERIDIGCDFVEVLRNDELKFKEIFPKHTVAEYYAWLDDIREFRV